MSVFLIRGLGNERDDAEKSVLQAGILLPIFHRAVWAANIHCAEPWFLLACDADGRMRGGFAVEQVMTRTMPGHKILRLRRSGGNLPGDVFKAMVEGLNVLVQNSPRILRVDIQVFSAGRRDEICRMLAQLGYRELEPPTVYRHTLAIDLRSGEEEIFATFRSTCRNQIRKAIKQSQQIEVLKDEVFADRIRDLQLEAMQRTGGHIPSEDWHAILRMSKERPDLSAVIGLFDGDSRSPENMMSFGWACNHGDSVEYRAAGSTRRTDVKIPYGNLVAWEMIRWAKAAGVEWFDFGGVTLSEGDDPLKGISNFKMTFTKEVLEVGAEWVCDPSPVRARLVDLVSERMQRVRARFGK